MTGYDENSASPPRRGLNRRWLLRIGSDLWMVTVGMAVGASVVLVWICGG